jgi:diketogulonate reductase-like aldo/keto reductase
VSSMTLHAFDNSAGKLATDRIDLLILHGPRPAASGAGHDPLAPAGRPQRHSQVGAAGADRENFGVFGFELTPGELKTLDALDTGVRGGPEPGSITLENFGRPIPEA